MTHVRPKQPIHVIIVVVALVVMATSCQSGRSDESYAASSAGVPTVDSDIDSADAAVATRPANSAAANQAPAKKATTPTPGATVVVSYETWDASMKDAWDGPIGAAFEASHPDIGLSYLATSAAEYNDKLLERFERGTAADLVACRPFTGSEELYDAGYITSLDDIDPGVLSESDFTAWTAEDGTRYCIPVTAVMQGFIYNADIFDQLDLEPPTTLSEFHATLEAIADDGRYVPLAIGLADPWRMGDLGFNIMGPTFWEGENGRQRLFTGEIDFTDERFVELLEEIQSWRPYLPEGAEFVDGSGAADLFTTGQAAIYPAGSWYLHDLRKTDFSVGAFPPPRRDASAPCYVIDQPDLGIGLNASSPNSTEAKAILQWLTTQDFVDVAAENLTGRFPMAATASRSSIPAVAQFSQWRSECIASMRLGTDIPRSDAFTERDAWDLVGQVVVGDLSPVKASQQLQQGLGANIEITEP